MNRSFSKIRHIQETNERLEKRFLTEQKTIINEDNNTISPTIPEGLGFNIQQSPKGEVVSWKNNQPDSSLPIASTNIIIKPGAKITVVKKGQVQIEGLLYFRKDGAKAGTTIQTGGSGPESALAVRGKSIPKTIWYDCSTSRFYLWFDSNKVIYSKTGLAGITDNGPFTKTVEWIGNQVCGYATQAELASAFKVGNSTSTPSRPRDNYSFTNKG